jgi:hypothetical protein
MAKLREIEYEYKDYRVGLRHSPDDFYPNSFHVETEGRRLIIVAVAKKHIRKKFRIVGVLKPR